MRNRALLLISTLGGQKSVWVNANDLGDKAMLHKIHGPDNKCTDGRLFSVPQGLHELLPHKTCSFTGEGMSKYSPHKSM